MHEEKYEKINWKPARQKIKKMATTKDAVSNQVEKMLKKK